MKRGICQTPALLIGSNVIILRCHAHKRTGESRENTWTCIHTHTQACWELILRLICCDSDVLLSNTNMDGAKEEAPVASISMHYFPVWTYSGGCCLNYRLLLTPVKNLYFFKEPHRTIHLRGSSFGVHVEARSLLKGPFKNHHCVMLQRVTIWT